MNETELLLAIDSMELKIVLLERRIAMLELRKHIRTPVSGSPCEREHPVDCDPPNMLKQAFEYMSAAAK